MSLDRLVMVNPPLKLSKDRPRPFLMVNQQEGWIPTCLQSITEVMSGPELTKMAPKGNNLRRCGVPRPTESATDRKLFGQRQAGGNVRNRPIVRNTVYSITEDRIEVLGSKDLQEPGHVVARYSDELISIHLHNPITVSDPHVSTVLLSHITVVL